LHGDASSRMPRFTREIPIGVEEETGAVPETPWVTYALIALNTIVYLVTSYSRGFIETSDRWASLLGFTPAELFANPLVGFARIFTAMFTHANIVHIFFNMYFLYLFGKAVERTLGHGRYLTLYLASGVMAAVFHSIFMYALSPLGMAIPSVGASGAISGVLGAYMVLYPGTRLAACFFLFLVPVCFELAAAYYLLFWFAIQVYMGYLLSSSSTVAFFAHAGGFVAGMALLPFLADRVRLAVLRLYAGARRLWGLIIFYPMYARRELSPPLKITLSMLIALLLIGSLYSLLTAERDPSLVTAYSIEVSLPRHSATYTGSFYATVNTVTRHGTLLAQTIAYNPLLLAPVKLLVDKNLLFNPNLHGTYTLSPGRSMLKVSQPISAVYIVKAERMRAVYDDLGLLVKGQLEGAIARFTFGPLATEPFTATIEREALNTIRSIAPIYATLAIAAILASLYTVLFKDRDLVITPE
jgi:membrane associated rhomboid family serine protease